MANAGLIIGFVRDRSGNLISGADVWIHDLFGDGKPILATGENNIRVGSPMTQTNSKGYFELAFAWSGADIAHAIGGGGRVRMFIRAMETVGLTDNSNISHFASPLHLTGYLIKDVLGQAGLAPPDLKSIPGLIEFSKDILDSAAKLKSHPIFKVNMLTTESWLILSAANLFVNKY